MAAVQTKAQGRQIREPMRDIPLKSGEFRGRNGEILRFRPTTGDQFEIPEELKETGWSYQWQAYTIYGEPSKDLAMMYANNWRYVPINSPIGKYFCIPGETGDCIIRGGQVLMERPQELTDMYIEETNEKTRLQYESLQGKSSDLVVPSGFESGGKVVNRERALARQSDLSDTGLLPSMSHAAGDIPDEE